jgi:hypothetical protein
MTVTAVFLLLSSVGCAPRQPGLKLKIVSRYESAATQRLPIPSESRATVYASGPNRRIEPNADTTGVRRPFPNIVTIERCDEHVAYALNPETREYMELPLPVASGSSAQANTASAKVIFDLTTVDTGETKKVFGHTARHYITTTKQTAAPESGLPPSETVEDAWYLDIADVMQCNSGSHRPHGVIGGGITSSAGGTRTPNPVSLPTPEFRYHGADPAGLTLSSKKVTRTTQHYVYGEAYETSSTQISEIVELKEVPVDPSLFQLPAGFKKVEKFTH